MMNENGTTRRDFLKTASAVVAGVSVASLAAAEPVDTTKILNYNPKMTYRPLGNTGFMISEIALGGHGGSTPDDRVPVLERAVELGMNYVDNNIDGECELYGAAMAKSKTAGRDKWFIGFASWPRKSPPSTRAVHADGMMKNIEARLKSYRTEMLDMWRPVGATWGEGQTKIATLLMVSEKALDMVVSVFEKAKQQGKVRFLGVSAHNPKVFRRVPKDSPAVLRDHLPLPVPRRRVRRRQPLEAGPGKERRRDRTQTLHAGRPSGQAQRVNGPVDPRAHSSSKKCSRNGGSRRSSPA